MDGGIVFIGAGNLSQRHLFIVQKILYGGSIVDLVDGAANAVPHGFERAVIK